MPVMSMQNSALNKYSDVLRGEWILFRQYSIIT